MVLKIQIHHSSTFMATSSDAESYAKQIMESISKHYSEFPLCKLKISASNNIIDLTADIHIKPISTDFIKVGFKHIPVNDSAQVYKKKGFHWISIKDKSGPYVDALKKFLIFVIGMVIIPSGMGWYNTDFADIVSAMQKGESATLINLENLHDLSGNQVDCLLAWVNAKVRFSTSLNQLMSEISKQFVIQNVLTLANITDYLFLKETNLLLVINK